MTCIFIDLLKNKLSPKRISHKPQFKKDHSKKREHVICPIYVTQQDLQLTAIFVAHLQLVNVLNKAAFNPSVACQSEPGSSGPMRAEQTMPVQLQMDRSCGSVERGQTALVSCLHCSSAACYASRSFALSPSISSVRRALNGTPLTRGKHRASSFTQQAL